MNLNWNWVMLPYQNYTYFALPPNPLPLPSNTMGCENIIMRLTNQEISTTVLDNNNVEIINKPTVELNHKSETSESKVKNEIEQLIIKNENSEFATNYSEDWTEVNVKEDLSIYEETESKNMELDWTEVNIKKEDESEIDEQIPENNVETETNNTENENLNNIVIDYENNLPKQNSGAKESNNKNANSETQNKYVYKGNGNEKFKCEFCSYKTNWKGNLTKHVTSRHIASEEIQWFECAHCPYRGKTKEYLKLHLSHFHDKSVKWYNCPHCPFKAKMKKCILDKHIIVNHLEHDKIQWFKCDLCSFKTKLNINLKHHKINMHTALSDIKWYKCEICPFKAKHKRNLKLHKLNLHTDSVKEKKKLKKHMERYHGEDSKSKLQQGGTMEIPVFIGNKITFKRVPISGSGCECFHYVDKVAHLGDLDKC